MNKVDRLKESFKQAKFKLGGHGTRNVDILKESFQNVDENLDSDMYGSGNIIEDFQNKMAKLLGKESAVFFPSGTMAQQIALRIWCDKQSINKVAYHPLSHLEIHEEDGLKEIHHIETFLLADKDRVIEFEDILNMNEEVSCILLELPQREIGGQLPSFETLEKISMYCKERGIKLHLDGARLLEVLPFYQKTASEICDLFDSVYMSFYKGLGGIAGAILAADQDFISKSKVWKRRYGGDLISLYPYIIPADYYFEKRVSKMDRYYEDAKELAKYFNSCTGVSTRPRTPVSNMFHVHFSYSKDKILPVLTEVQQATGVGITSYVREIDDKSCYFELSLGDLYTEIPSEKVDRVFQMLDTQFKLLID